MPHNLARKYAVLNQTREPLRSLLGLLNRKSPESNAHSRRVSTHSIALGMVLELTEDELTTLHFGAVLHDLGKIDGEIVDVVHKNGKLDARERALIELHPERGAEMLRRYGMPQDVIAVTLHHHERWDGTGYPSGLRGEEIPLLARLVALVDTYDTIISKRSYEPPRRVSVAISEIERCAGAQFDPTLAHTFLRVLYKKHASTLERYATHAAA